MADPLIQASGTSRAMSWPQSKLTAVLSAHTCTTVRAIFVTDGCTWHGGGLGMTMTGEAGLCAMSTVQRTVQVHNDGVATCRLLERKEGWRCVGEGIEMERNVQRE